MSKCDKQGGPKPDYHYSSADKESLVECPSPSHGGAEAVPLKRR